MRPGTVLSADNRVLLAGYGSAAPGLGIVLGVDAYTPPEHVAAALRGETAASKAGDLYDLAATMYIAAGGRLPWTDAPDDPALRTHRLPAVRGMSEGLFAVLQAALAVDPTARPSAPAFAQLLAALGPESTTPGPAPADRAALRTAGLRRVAGLAIDELATGAASAAGGAVGGMLAARAFGSTSPPAPGPAPSAPPAPTGPPPGVPAPTPAAGGAPGGAGVGAGTSIAVKVIVVAVAAGGLAGGGYLYTKADQAPTGSSAAVAGPLRADPARRDFGTIWVGTKSEQTVTVTNTGTTPRRFDSTEVSGQGFSVGPDKCAGLDLGAGAKCTVAVALQPEARQRYDGKVSIHSGSLVLTVPLAGQGDTADLAGQYTLVLRSNDPPKPLSDDFIDLLAWDVMTGLGDDMVAAGTRISTLTSCAQPPSCRYGIEYGDRVLPLTGGEDETLHADYRYTGDARTDFVLRPGMIDGGKVMSFVLTMTTTVVQPDRSRVLLTQTFAATRRGEERATPAPGTPSPSS